jgi:hypothetical protein
MFASRFHSVSACFLLGLALVAAATAPVSAQSGATKPQAPTSPPSQQMQQQFLKGQQFLLQEEMLIVQLEQQQLYQQIMQNWYQQQMFRLQTAQQWQAQQNATASPVANAAKKSSPTPARARAK